MLMVICLNLVDTLNDVEKEYLAFAPQLITYTIAVRFLTDFIDGDNYFKINREFIIFKEPGPSSNLSNEHGKQYEEMRKIIRNSYLKSRTRGSGIKLF